MNKTIAGLAAAACLVAAGLPVQAQSVGQMAANPPAELITNGPQSSPGDNAATWSARRNVAESQNYERLLRTNPGFRQARERKECGPIDDPTLHQQCVATFQGG